MNNLQLAHRDIPSHVNYTTRRNEIEQVSEIDGHVTLIDGRKIAFTGTISRDGEEQGLTIASQDPSLIRYIHSYLWDREFRHTNNG